MERKSNLAKQHIVCEKKIGKINKLSQAQLEIEIHKLSSICYGILIKCLMMFSETTVLDRRELLRFVVQIKFIKRAIKRN